MTSTPTPTTATAAGSLVTSYRVTDQAGGLLGIFPKSELTAVKALVSAHPGSHVRPVVTITGATCAAHPAFEADNCPSCGTTRMRS